MMVSIVICDNDERDANRTKSILTEFYNSFFGTLSQEIFIYQEGEELLADIIKNKVKPSILFMDVDMGKKELNGIDLAKKVNTLLPECHIIYLTNYLEYAPNIFLTEHLFFVLKKELEKRLPEIYLKILRRKKENQKVFQIAVKKNEYMSIEVSDIIYMEREGRKTFIYGKEKSLETYLSLNDLEEALRHHNIIRCHNSYMVSLIEIVHYVRENCLMSNGKEIPISRKYQPGFKKVFLAWSKGQMF